MAAWWFPFVPRVFVVFRDFSSERKSNIESPQISSGKFEENYIVEKHYGTGKASVYERVSQYGASG